MASSSSQHNSTAAAQAVSTTLSKMSLASTSSDRDGSVAAEKEKSLQGITFSKRTEPSEWYRQVLTQSQMISYYDVSGCYILRPWAFAIWENIQAYFDAKIRASGVENCYFPMLVTSRALNREKEHIAGFAPEVAWITRAGSSDLQEPVAVRPTSETIMYPAYRDWIQSHRDLPLRLNQWCNVLRWEFKHPQPFLRTREFLWQEGHSAFLRHDEALRECSEILEYYREVYEDLLAVPVITGRKSEAEKFAGAERTYTIEAFVPATGRGIQGATSHCLGQNFAKMFRIEVEDENKEKTLVWQNSWGLTTRTIGVMVMVHGDDKGLVLPPRVASVQVIVVPCGITVKTTAAQREEIGAYANKVVDDLKANGLRARVDSRDQYSPGFKFNYWELRGVPLRIEVGPRDMAKEQVVFARRDTGEKSVVAVSGIGSSAAKVLDQVHHDMLERARAERDASVVVVESWDDPAVGASVPQILDMRKLVLAPWCGAPECEDQVKEMSARSATAEASTAAAIAAGLVAAPAARDESENTAEGATETETTAVATAAAAAAAAPSMGAKSLCTPFKQPRELKHGTKCFGGCGADAKSYTLFGRSY